MENANQTQNNNRLPAEFTIVEELYIEGQRNYRLLFGKPLRTVTKQFEYGKITRKWHYFIPASVFALDLWDQNEYGTSQWKVFVLEAALPGEIVQRIPQVDPGAKILLDASGQKSARAALRELKEIEERLDPTTLPPNYFLLTDFRLKESSLSKRGLTKPFRKRA